MQQGRLAGKVALITGAGSGIGRAAAIRFAQEGAKIVVAELSAAAGEETRRLVTDNGGQCLAVVTDVRESQSVKDVVEKAFAQFGRIDILYNNAGGSTMADARVGDAAPDEFWRAISLDLFGTWLCCHVVIPKMVDQGGGTVINASSIVGIRGIGGKDAYTAAKGAIVALTRSMAVEYAPAKIRVNALAPSTTKTERIMSMLGKNDEASMKAVSRHLLGLPEPEDIANAALFLASDESRMITGHILPVDSGYSAS